VHGELFFQLSGRTVFTFPTAELVLRPGELLLVPALVTHAERAEAFLGERFRNLVLYAGNGVFSVHVARADAVERPVIDYIERPASPRVRAAVGYLQDAAIAAERATITDGVSVACGAEGAAASGAFLFTSCGSGSAASEVLVRSLVCAALAEAELALEPAKDRASVLSDALSAAGPAATPGDRAYAAPLPRLVAECRTLALASLTDAELSVARLAEWLGCAADYLSHLHKASTGEALASFITRARVERADELLAETRLSVKEVSWACGFSSESYFIRKFKARYGETPAARRAVR
jgi:AraC-like DNA-binding protein